MDLLEKVFVSYGGLCELVCLQNSKDFPISNKVNFASSTNNKG